MEFNRIHRMLCFFSFADAPSLVLDELFQAFVKSLPLSKLDMLLYLVVMRVVVRENDVNL